MHGFHATPSGGPSIPESVTVLRSAVSGFDDPPALLLAVSAVTSELVTLVLALARSARPSARRRAGTSGPQVLAVPAGLALDVSAVSRKRKGGPFPAALSLPPAPASRKATGSCHPFFDARACGMAQPRQTNDISGTPSHSVANNIVPLQHLPIPHPTQKSDERQF